jgi:nucleotide-binding universal stress UspA family protein
MAGRKKEVTMSNPDETRALPRKLLLATDLSCRCDRALDRAVALCREWQAELVVVHALEMSPELLSARTRRGSTAWYAPENRIAAVEWQLRRDLAAGFVQPTIVVEEGDPAELVLKTAREHGCDLIVSGIARDESFGRLILGSTVDALVRAAPVPLLVVKNRSHGPYEHLLVATDFSAESRTALDLAVQIQPHGPTLFHAFDAPFSGWTGRTQYLAEAQAHALESCRRFLDEAGLPSAIREGIYAIAEHGTLSELPQDQVRNLRVDLILLGLPERGPVMEALIGSRAKAALDLVSCDILMVRSQAAEGKATSGA